MSIRIQAMTAALMCGACIFATTTTVRAATVNFEAFYSNNSEMVTPTVSANDDTSGKITVELNIDPSSTQTGLLSAIWFDFSPTLEQSDMTVPVAIDTFANNNLTTNLGSGTNLNGCSGCLVSPATGGAFDVGFNFDPADPNVNSNGGVDVTSDPPFDPFVFSFDDLGLSLSNLTGIGLRFQSVTGGNETSDKVVSFQVTQQGGGIPSVPVPAALPLLLTALSVGGFVGWRRRKAAAA